MYPKLSSWYLPLRGTPCANCGQPAERMAVFPAERVIAHVDGGGPPCHLPNLSVSTAELAETELYRRQAA